ncbi:MAG: hypothetical protein U1D66_06860 [Erythrobacter sp.]|nr:hypothetical protein [Erythrobacter sp.]
MKGRILGFNESDGAGAISAEDGSRHKFTSADWRGERPPTVGMSVDFESSEGQAKDIYPISGAARAALGSMNVDLGSLSASPEGAKVAALFTRSLAVPLALVVIAACFMNAMSSPVMSVNLIDLGKVMDGLNLASIASSMSGEGNSGLGMVSTILFLRFAAPLAAVWLIWASWAGKPERVPMLVAGMSAIGAALLVIGLKSAAMSMLPDFMREEISAAISLGLGVWVLLLAGGALVAAALGKLRNPLVKE